MTVSDLIMELAQMPPEMEVIYDNTREGEEVFRMVVVQNVGQIETDTGDKYVLLNLNEEGFINNDEDDEDI